MVKQSLKIVVFFFGLLLMGQSLHAQEWQLIMEMVVTNDGRKMDGATIELRKNGSLVKTFTTDAKGNVDVPLDPNGDYEISISGNGMIKKKLAINTSGVPAEDIKGTAYFPAEVDIFPKIDGLDLKILDEPIGKIRYDAAVGGFDADLDYTRKRKAALDKIAQDYQKQKANEAKEQAAKQKEYDAAIKLADKAYSSEKWEEAEREYKRAAEIMPIETYPSFQLAELETKLIKIRETNAKYDQAIKLADAAAAKKDYQTAADEYKKATSFKPDEAYPQDKLKEVQGLLSDMVKRDQTYLAAIERGDNALKINDLNTAKTSFEEAAAAKPEETYPKNKLAEINDILGKQQAKEEEYNTAIKAADEALAAKSYEKAKAEYKKALQVKPAENYPQEQITRVDGLIAESAKKEQNYLAAIEKGDNALAQNTLEAAIAAFEEAAVIKPTEEYPKNKIKEIKDVMAKREVADKEYQEKIKEADESLASKEYEAAKTAYQAAIALKPKESYPTEKVKEIEGILAAKAAADKNYKDAIAKADQALAAKNYQAAKESYSAASAIKPEEKYPQDKLAEIGTIMVKIEESKAAYNEAIKNGDEALAAKDLEAAKKFYTEAKGLKAEETYPQQKLDEIAAIIAKKEETERLYKEAIAAADEALKNEKLEAAKTEYTKAKGLKPEESYPTEQIAKVDAMMAEAAKEEQSYLAALEKGDNALKGNQLEVALAAFNEATGIKPAESYPKEKITEIQAIIKKAEADEAAYTEAIKAADKLFQSKSYEEAKAAYQSALKLKDDQYPKDQIAAADEKLATIAAEAAAAAKLEADYQAAIAEGQAKLDAKDFPAALTAYNKAASLKPDESLPKDKIAEVQKAQAELEAKKAEEARLAELQKNYDEKIAIADKAYKEKNLKDARTAYQEALTFKENESYPQGKIDEINGLLADAAEQDELYASAISAADKLLADEKLEEAKVKYQEASSIKTVESYPKEKIGEIDTKIAALAAKQEEIRLKQAKEEETQKKYDQLLSEGDALAASEEFNKAIVKYEEALTVKDEQLPKDKIADMKAKILEKESQMAAAEKEKIEAEYQAFIKEADAAFKANEFATAIEKYNTALGVKDDQYPKDQIATVKAKQAELENAAEKAKKDAAYNELISAADEAFNANEFVTATEKYNAALGVKDEQYPKDQLLAIKTKKAELENAAEKEKREAEYNKLISSADALFNSEDFDAASAKYKAALELKDEQYPKDQIAAIATKKDAIGQAKQDAQYQALVSEADAFLEIEKLDEAAAKYREALSIKERQYPQDQLSMIEERQASLANKQAQIAAAAELEANYKNVIAAADKAFQAKNYQEALLKYQEAISVKEGDPYPSEKIEEINAILAKENQKDQITAQYKAAITAGDQALAAEDYTQAKAEYEKALEIKANESYPKDQIVKVNDLLAQESAEAEEIRIKREREAKNEAAYQTAITEGDQLLSNKQYEPAINKYELAQGLKPTKTYPAEQIEKIKALQQKDQIEAERLAKENQDREKRYVGIIAEGNKLFKEKDYQMAIRQYQAALAMKPNEAYPKAKIKEINSILNGDDLASKEEKITDEPIKIQKGAKATIDGSAEAELDRIYKEMWDKKNVDKNQMIAEKREIVRKLREADKEKESSKRLNAIQKIENISISMAEQRKGSDELHLQNYETVKANTTTIEEKEEELIKESERMRNNSMGDKENQLKNIEENQKEKYIELISGKKEAVEEDYDDQQEFRKDNMTVQQNRIEKLDEEYVQKDEDIRTFNNEIATQNLHKNTSQIKEVEENWDETIDGYQNGLTERTTAENDKAKKIDEDIREFARERNIEYLKGYKDVQLTEKDVKEFTDEKNEGSLDRRMKEQENINDVANTIRSSRLDGNEMYGENYIKVVEKTEALKTEQLSLDKESEQRRQENAAKEFYEGEDNPRQDSESANYPQGVTEKIIENSNGSTTIKRIVVEGTETNIYEKTLHPWGGVFYTRNGTNITEEAWDLESK